MASPNPPIPPVTTATRLVMLISSENRSHGLRFHIAARRGLELPVPRAADVAPRSDASAAERRQPGAPVRPPASGPCARTVEPAMFSVRHGIVHPVVAPVFRNRI